MNHCGAEQPFGVFATVLNQPVVENTAAIAGEVVVLYAHRIEHRCRVEDLGVNPVLVGALQANGGIFGRAKQLLLVFAFPLDQLVELEGLDPGKIETSLMALPFRYLARDGVAVFLSERGFEEIHRLDDVRIGRDQ